MNNCGFRLRYRFTLPEERKIVRSRIESQIRTNNPAGLKLRTIKGLLIIRFPSGTSQLWTPQVSMALKDAKGGGTLLNAVVGPSYRIWRFFRSALSGFVFLAMVGILLAFYQAATGGGTSGFYLFMTALGGGLFLYFLSEEGKRRSNDDVELLLTFMDDALGSDLFLPLSRKNADRLSRRMA